MADDNLGNLTGRFTLTFGSLHGDIAGKIPMFGIGRRTDNDGRKG